MLTLGWRHLVFCCHALLAAIIVLAACCNASFDSLNFRNIAKIQVFLILIFRIKRPGFSIDRTGVRMKVLSFTCVVSATILLATNLAFANGQSQQLSSERAASPRRSALEIVVAQSTTSGQRSIIIVSGKNSQPGSPNSFNKPGSKFNNPTSKFSNPGSKVTLNPQPLPPRTTVNTSINSNASKVMLNPQPLPPKTR